MQIGMIICEDGNAYNSALMNKMLKETKRINNGSKFPS